MIDSPFLEPYCDSEVIKESFEYSEIVIELL